MKSKTKKELVDEITEKLDKLPYDILNFLAVFIEDYLKNSIWRS